MEVNQNLVDLLNEWKKQHLWQGTIDERKQKFLWMNEHMQVLFRKPIILDFDITEESDKIPNASASSYYYRNKIVLIGRLSVITFLHEWAHAIGMNQKEAVDWSLLHFKEAFPKSFSRLADGIGTMKIKGDDNE